MGKHREGSGSDQSDCSKSSGCDDGSSSDSEVDWKSKYLEAKKEYVSYQHFYSSS